MPRRANELTPAQIKKLSHPGGERPVQIAVGGIAGLIVQVRPSGAKSWLLRGRFGDWQERTDRSGKKIRERKKREIGLGPYPEVLLGTARDKAREIKAQFANGVDPIAERRANMAAVAASATRARTFKAAFGEYAKTKAAEFSSERYLRQWSSVAERYAYPAIGDMSVQDIQLADVLGVLAPIWEGKNPTATKLRQIIEGTLAFATVHGYRTGDNPARWQGNLSVVLAAPGRVSKAALAVTVGKQSTKILMVSIKLILRVVAWKTSPTQATSIKRSCIAAPRAFVRAIICASESDW